MTTETKPCISQIYNLCSLAHRHGFGRYGLRDELAPGESLSIPLKFAKTGAVQLFIKGNVLSRNAPIRLAIYDENGQEIWGTRPSTIQIIANAIDLKAPGTYQFKIENPNSAASAWITGVLNVVMCNSPAIEPWLDQYTKSAIKYVAIKNAEIPMAPMGIASYGVKMVDDQYSTYTLAAEAVKGIIDISSNISASGYRSDCLYHRRAFSVQLNAFVVVKLTNGASKYYWARNIIRFDENINGFEVLNDIWNMTNSYLTLDDEISRYGDGEIRKDNYLCPGSSYYRYRARNLIPFGRRVELMIRVSARYGYPTIEFYVNGQMYDSVPIKPKGEASAPDGTPAPSASPASAHVTIAPITTPTGLPLGVELVLGGFSEDIPYAVLETGQIDLDLYVYEGGMWKRPPSAWNIGFVAREVSHARVIPKGDGTAIIMPGEPNPQQLW